MANDELLPLSEIAAELSLNPATIRNWVNQSRLPALRDPDDPRRWLVYRKDVEAFLSGASRQDIGRPKPRGGSAEVEHEDWSEAPDEPTLNLVNPRRPDSAAEGAVVSVRTALEQIAKSDVEWAQAIHGFEEYPARLRALADAAEMRGRTMMLAHLANMTGNPRPGVTKLPGLAPLLSPGRDRPGPAALWKQFDGAAKKLMAALEDGSLQTMAIAFEALAPLANALADACEQDGSGIGQAV